MIIRMKLNKKQIVKIFTLINKTNQLFNLINLSKNNMQMDLCMKDKK